MWTWLDIRGRDDGRELLVALYAYVALAPYLLLWEWFSPERSVGGFVASGGLWAFLPWLGAATVRRSHDLGGWGFAAIFVVAGPALVAAGATARHLGDPPASLLETVAPAAILLTFFTLFGLKDSGKPGSNRFGAAPIPRMSARPMPPRLGWLQRLGAGRAGRSRFVAISVLWASGLGVAPNVSSSALALEESAPRSS